ncbi:MAG: HesA/MoeB/ThiF family protein [Nitrososphaerota archaeon]|nr:HesA/MoeB/ThiF family protein [Candidatus Bathyarchaeota archaeon]MDW8193439.1 HesA/MoeB/ThiF family protein [Nitrososphaerota archaeon]
MNEKGKVPFSYEEFYSRHLVMREIGIGGQKKLASSRVAVIGVGGLGTVSSLYLALAGVGYLRLIDGDLVEAKNLHRQILYRPRDLGKPKAEVAAERLSEANPFIQVEPALEKLNSNNAENLLRGVDCVVDGLDNMRSRYIVNRACAKLRIPYVFGAAMGMEGNMSVFAPPETPCLECVLPNINDNILPQCETRGVLSPTPGIIGTMLAMETIKLLLRVGQSLKGKLMICDFNDMYLTIIEINKRENCPACQT